MVVVELIEDLRGHFFKGMTFCFYFKKIPGAKLIGSGILVSGGMLEIEDRTYNNKDLPYDEEELAKIRAKKLELDFKF